MHKVFATWTLIFFILGTSQSHATGFIYDYVPHAEKVGTGELRYAFWPVYQAMLYAPHGAWSPDKPFALSLVYQRSISGKTIAETSIQEIRRLYKTDEFQLAAWYEQMLSIFPDVHKGSRLTGFRTREGHTVFFRNDQKIGEITDPDFTRAFFSIWLSPRTRDPELRQRILGQYD